MGIGFFTRKKKKKNEQRERKMQLEKEKRKKNKGKERMKMSTLLPQKIFREGKENEKMKVWIMYSFEMHFINLDQFCFNILRNDIIL